MITSFSSSSINDDTQGFYLPTRLGLLTQSRTFDSPLMIFKIEDTSFGIDTEQGIVDLLPYLHGQFGVETVCLEGAAGEFPNLSKLGENLSTKQKEQLRAELEQGQISGAEFVMLTGDLPFTLYGVENAEQYVKNREALVQAYYGSKVTLLISKLKRLVEVLKRSVYTPELYAFDQAMAQYEQGTLSLGALAGLIREYAKNRRIQLDRFPNLVILIKALELEIEIHQKMAEFERGRFIEDIIEVLTADAVPIPFLRRVVKTKQEIAERRPPLELVDDYRQIAADIQKKLLDLSVMFREDRVRDVALYDLMVDISSLCDLDIRRFPQLLLYIHYLHQAKRIKGNALIDEVQQATNQIQEKLFENDDQRALAKTCRRLDGLQKLCSLEMSPHLSDRFKREFGHLTFTALLQDNYIQQAILPAERAALDVAIQNLEGILEKGEEEKILDLLDRHCSQRAGTEDELERLERELENLKFTELLADADHSVAVAFPMAGPLVRGLIHAEIAVDGAYRFSQLAPARGRTLAENTLRYMKEQGVTMAVLITGGYLTSQILPVLERERISYRVFIPKTQPSKITKKIYGESMAGNTTRSEFLRDLIASLRADGKTNDRARSNEQPAVYPL